MSLVITELDNGLRIATDTMNDAESVVVGAWVGVGTRHEPWNANGVAHLVEHMMFKGTKSRSAYAISSAIENKGGDMNAHTSREETAYYARVLPEEAENAIDVISDMLLRSVLDPKELERERQVVIQEIGHDIDSPEDHVYDLMYQTALPNQKMGRSILGTTNVIAKLPRLALEKYIKQYYVASNMVLVATGKIEHKDFVSMVKKRFSRLKGGKKPKAEPAKITHGANLLSKEIEQVHLLLGFAGPGYRKRKPYYAAQLLSLILGGSSSSRLFQKVREKRGLVYSVGSSNSSFCDAGIFHIYAGTDPLRLKELIPVICGELIDVKSRVMQGELARAKAQIRAELLMGKESVMRRAETIGHQLLAHGQPISAEEILSGILSVSEEDLQATASRMFARKPVLAALGPLDELENYKEIAARLSA